MLQAPIVCAVLKAQCKGGTCFEPFSGEESGIFQWTKLTACADEVGWDFKEAFMHNNQSFTHFTLERTRQYRSAYPASAEFMSPGTFLKWYFNWMAAQKIDYRITGDPCQNDPDCELLLVFDGTHRGPSEKYLKGENFDVINRPTVDTIGPQQHSRYTRVLLPYKSYSDTTTKPLRTHLDQLCRRIYQQGFKYDDNAQLNKNLLARCTDARFKTVVQVIIDRSFDNVLLKPMANVLGSMIRDAPLLQFIPWKCRNRFRILFANVLRGTDISASLKELYSYKPPLATVLKLAAPSNIAKTIVVNFYVYLVDELERIHGDDIPYPVAKIIDNTYRPDLGGAYHFTKHSNRVRDARGYKADKKTADKPVTDKCTKKYPKVGRGGFGYLEAVCCAKHHHIIGSHIIAGGEGAKDVMYPLYLFCPEPPNDIFYDNSCHADEYCYSREPNFFREINWWHDNFHGEKNHKCGWCYKPRRVKRTWHLNTAACEQFNAFILCIKYTASHLTLAHFCHFMQFAIHHFNVEKTKNYKEKLENAMNALRGSRQKPDITHQPQFSKAINDLLIEQYHEEDADVGKEDDAEATPIELDWGDNCDCQVDPNLYEPLAGEPDVMAK